MRAVFEGNSTDFFVFLEYPRRFVRDVTKNRADRDDLSRDLTSESEGL